MFSELVPTDNEESTKLTPDSIRKNIGTIEIRIFRCNSVVGEIEAEDIPQDLFVIKPKVKTFVGLFGQNIGWLFLQIVTPDEIKDKRSHCTTLVVLSLYTHQLLANFHLISFDVPEFSRRTPYSDRSNKIEKINAEDAPYTTFKFTYLSRGKPPIFRSLTIWNPLSAFCLARKLSLENMVSSKVGCSMSGKFSSGRA